MLIILLQLHFSYTEDGIPSETLKSITLETVDYDQCKRESADFQNFVTKDKICAGNKDNSGVCLGMNHQK